MTTYDGMLVRDDLSDTGVTPSTAYPYYSPDMINHPTVSDPTTYFTGNYASDPNVALEVGQYNYIYGRAKNLSTSTLGGTLRMYYSPTSLVMNSDTWANNPLHTQSGASTLTLPSVSPGSVSVGTDCFVWRPPSGSTYGYCWIGMIGTVALPNPVPAAFSDWASFVNWVRTNQNVGWRNIVIQDNFPNPQWDNLSTFENIEDDDVPALFTATASSNMPVGTVLTLKCSALSINVSKTITATDRILTASAICPANYSGLMETMGLLPSGASWPPNGSITTTFFIGQTSTSEIAKYAHPFERLGVTPADIVGLDDNGVLVQIGTTATLFSS